ncbi:hypothetical protein REBECCA_241 [Erwinia phage Rebecca]|uniref:Uncharacterized protein n=3 Tax=Agricanvirus TaxID=1984776 RepID=A0A191ZCE1_9CAUD|nr:hypothetical protein FDH99_gp282 [Erwinia phage vB_EamM_Simmy50]YP_009606348.1 hypothetical protein FDI00_gp242 [Erwinia phage vB_EamM_Special G]ANH51703.1 hypothetical protein SIMMY50_244 [Erwinia phage vB_EamM_Simmy50]ANJ65054.1 hypothetical protein SPECIALG_243 [Erwinia phage vB_EamM_Special G]QBP07346.1 hypothetical protein REBECCA_241 [Erwinia phage Rebecca]
MADRTMGILPMSVGTSLSFEALMAKPIEPIETLVLNIGTIFRNVYQAYDTDDRDRLGIDKLHDDVIADMSAIYDILKDIGKAGVPDYKLYHGRYERLASAFPLAKIWEPSSDIQKTYARLERNVLEKVIKTMRGLVQEVDHTLPISVKNTYVMTHHIVDLVVPAGYGEITLVESHTGALKKKPLWHTKLTNGRSLERIPFNRLTLQVFGDNSVNFKANSFKYKAALMKLAEENKWTPMATRDRIKLGIETLKDAQLKADLSKMLSV